MAKAGEHIKVRRSRLYKVTLRTRKRAEANRRLREADAAYARHMTRGTERSQEIEQARSEDPTWNGTGRTRAWSRSEARKAHLRSKRTPNR